MKKYCLTVDLIDDPELIREYEYWHRPENIWPEIKKSIRDAGIIQMDIYRVGNRLIMVMETEDAFSFERKAFMDQANESVQEWERMMWKYQQALPFAGKGEKWMEAEKIFGL